MQLSIRKMSFGVAVARGAINVPFDRGSSQGCRSSLRSDAIDTWFMDEAYIGVL
jgi:hypothetical protein